MLTMKNISFRDVELCDGFWKKKQDMDRKVTIHSVYNRFKDTGRFDALELGWKEGMPNRPHIFYDSDTAKWLESAAELIQKEPDPTLEALRGVVRFHRHRFLE